MRDKVVRAGFGLLAPFCYDVLHYYFGRSYLHRANTLHSANFADLKLARRLGRRVFMTLQGCDARLAAATARRYVTSACRADSCGLFATCIDRLDRVRKTLIDDVLPLCDRVFYLNPDLGHTTPGEFLPYASCDIAAIGPTAVPSRPRPLILHAPTDRSIKGSDRIEAALGELSVRFAFDYRPVTGLRHDQAMQLYRSADLVIDQIRVGWYGGLAVEQWPWASPSLPS